MTERNSGKRGFLQGAISGFILFHLIAIACWALPLNFSPVKDVREFVRPYMLWTGLFQSWDTFAPDPKAINSYLEAVAITQNRKQKVWVFPRMEQLGYGARYREERYRKFAEVLPQRSLSAMWPDVAQRVTRLFDDPSDPPAVILLIQFQAPIQPWMKQGVEPALKPNIFYEYVNSIPASLPIEDLK